MAILLPRRRAMTSVLIVDDEPAVRDIMSRWVKSLGLRSHTVASADEALATLRTQHYDLAVIDVAMPGHDGLWLANEMHLKHPNTAVVIATAYTDRLDSERPRPDVADFLVKPFPRERFALAVDRNARRCRADRARDPRMVWRRRLSAEARRPGDSAGKPPDCRRRCLRRDDTDPGVSPAGRLVRRRGRAPPLLSDSVRSIHRREVFRPAQTSLTNSHRLLAGGGRLKADALRPWDSVVPRADSCTDCS